MRGGVGMAEGGARLGLALPSGAGVVVSAGRVSVGVRLAGWVGVYF